MLSPAITILVSILCVISVLISPLAGLIMVMATLYFALFSKFDLGLVTISVSTLPVIMLAFVALFKLRQYPKSYNLRGWKVLLILSLFLAFTVPTLLSFSLADSLVLYLNLVLYVIILFGVMVLVRTPAQFVIIWKAILVLTPIFALWPILRWLRSIFELSSLRGNSMIFQFHPTIALSLILLMAPQLDGFSRRWRILALFDLLVIELWVFGYEARAGLIAEMVMLILAILAFPIRRTAPILILVAALSISMLFLFPTQVQKSLTMTLETLQGTRSERINESAMDSSDILRLISARAAMDMFRQRPLTGWGPAMYELLRPEFVIAPSQRYIATPGGGVWGAFNSWLTILAEMGLVSTLIVAAFNFLPLLIAWRKLRVTHYSQPAIIAFAFALGLVGMAVHLYFIDLVYGSFEWVFVALAWSALGITREEVSRSLQMDEKLTASTVGQRWNNTYWTRSGTATKPWRRLDKSL